MIEVYGLKVSYFTGKLEGYLRYKKIPYLFRALTANEFMNTIPEKTGAMQMPAVKLPDGRWMSDTSPMIDWFEQEHPNSPILPENPELAFLCRLIEDYADEWLWRPAMHYRWSYPVSSKLLARQISNEMGAEIKIPNWIKRWQTERRQKYNFVKRDGVTKITSSHVEDSYVRLLAILNPIFSKRSFIFGERPSLADFGLFGPLFRHFSMDPKPAIIMRETAPAVMEWVYRLWNARASKSEEKFLRKMPKDLLPLLKEIGETHLEALNANTKAYQKAEKRHDAEIQGVLYRDLQTSAYRVWCLENLQANYGELDENSQSKIDNILKSQNALEPLLRLKNIQSGYNLEGIVPFGLSKPVFEEVRN